MLPPPPEGYPLTSLVLTPVYLSCQSFAQALSSAYLRFWRHCFGVTLCFCSYLSVTLDLLSGYM